MDSSLNQTIIHLIESGAKVAPETPESGAKVAPERRQNGATPRERASSPSAQKENNNINTLTEAVGSDASRISSFSSFGNNKENSKKAPPDFLPDDWEPPEGFQHEWCRKREYCYKTALEIFKSKFKADPQRCSDWDSKWRFFLLNGYLKGAKWSELDEEESYGMAIGRYQPSFGISGSPRKDL
jgi:hypothetical protein